MNVQKTLGIVQLIGAVFAGLVGLGIIHPSMDTLALLAALGLGVQGGRQTVNGSPSMGSQV